MGKEYTKIDKRIIAWIKRQHMFFVATAPLSDTGLINCSPKGLDTFRVLDPTEVAYLDFPGSGVETIAHVRENRRIVIMMCAFEGPPKIFRFYGYGKIVEPDHREFDALINMFDETVACRAIVRIKVHRILDSCGFGVPNYAFKGQRKSLENFFSATPKDEIESYLEKNNRMSLDKLPALDQPKLVPRKP